jgi:3-phenylpropionate/cinnamic acid dioxygenase small subunit
VKAVKIVKIVQKTAGNVVEMVFVKKNMVKCMTTVRKTVKTFVVETTFASQKKGKTYRLARKTVTIAF